VLTAFQLEAVRFDVHNRVRRAYADLVAATAYAELTETQSAIAQHLLEISQKRYTAGKAAGAEVLQAKLGVMQYATQRNQAWGKLVQESATLEQLLGESPHQQEIVDVERNPLFMLQASKSELAPAPQAGVPPLDQLLPAAWRQRNDLKSAIQQAFANRKAVTLAKSQRIPDPFIGFNYLFSTYKPYQPIYFDPQFGRVPFQPGYMLTVQHENPIFYHYQGEVNQAKAKWEEQLKQVDLKRAQIAADIVSAYEALVMTRANIEKYQSELLPDSEKAAQLGRRAYELGKTDLATAMLAQQQYQQMRYSYFDAIVSYQRAWSDLERSVGVGLK
jgi:cobalt-zinc-cadmium efflux system outer membrane protein